MKKKLITLLVLLCPLRYYAQYWVEQNSGVSYNLYDVYCISADTVIIVGDEGTILKTTNGGVEWASKVSGTHASLRKVQFITDMIGYAVGFGGTILKSVDAGETWTSIASGVGVPLTGIAVRDEDHFFISGLDGLIKKTNDGGLTFIDQSYASESPINTIQFLNDQVGYASGYDIMLGGFEPVFLKTLDGGAHWNFMSNQVSSFYFIDENIGFLKDYEGIQKTSDGGQTWTLFGDPGFIAPEIFAFNEEVVWYVENNLFVCDCNYYCVKKIDKTLPLNLQNAANCRNDFNGGHPFEAIQFANPTTGYVVGWQGKILKNSTGLMENLALNDFAAPEAVTLYPNPAAHTVSITFENNRPQRCWVSITDLLGKTVSSNVYANNPETTIDIESFAKGIYLVKIESGNGSVTKKLIKD